MNILLVNPVKESRKSKNNWDHDPVALRRLGVLLDKIPRLAWDLFLGEINRVKAVFDLLFQIGYRPKDVFVSFFLMLI